MAFMMPVVKNEWDIYKPKRSRRVSESALPSKNRSRKVSECKSEGPPTLSTSPSANFATIRSVPANMSRQYSMPNSGQVENSPTESDCSSPTATDSESSFKFHFRLFDKLKRSSKKRNSKNSESSNT